MMALTIWEKHFSDYWELGPILIYGENAMHWAVNIRIGNGLFCFRLPFRCYGRWWPLYVYYSEDGTPQGAKWIFPKSYRKGGG